MSPASWTRARVAAAIDHTILRPDATAADVRRVCTEARENSCASVCVNGARIAIVVEQLAGSRVVACAVVGFPLGATAASAKADEAARLVRLGAREIDMVMNVGLLKDRSFDAVADDISAVVRASDGAAVKVILETCLLTDEEKSTACRLAVDAGAAFVKTSTGFGSAGATIADVKLMKAAVNGRAMVKASGGIRDTAAALAMLEAGADRLGLSATVAVLAGLPE